MQESFPIWCYTRKILHQIGANQSRIAPLLSTACRFIFLRNEGIQGFYKGLIPGVLKYVEKAPFLQKSVPFSLFALSCWTLDLLVSCSFRPHFISSLLTHLPLIVLLLPLWRNPFFHPVFLLFFSCLSSFLFFLLSFPCSFSPFLPPPPSSPYPFSQFLPSRVFPVLFSIHSVPLVVVLPNLFSF